GGAERADRAGPWGGPGAVAAYRHRAAAGRRAAAERAGPGELGGGGPRYESPARRARHAGGRRPRATARQRPRPAARWLGPRHGEQPSVPELARRGVAGRDRRAVPAR